MTRLVGTGKSSQSHARSVKTTPTLNQRWIDCIEFGNGWLKAHVIGHRTGREIAARAQQRFLALTLDVLTQSFVGENLRLDRAHAINALLDQRGEICAAVRSVLQDRDALFDELGSIATRQSHHLAKRRDLAAVDGFGAGSVDIEIRIGHPIGHGGGDRPVRRLKADLDHAGRTRT